MKPAEDTPLDFLSNQKVTFYIPPYQRNYEWDEKTCKVFLMILSVRQKKT